MQRIRSIERAGMRRPRKPCRLEGRSARSNAVPPETIGVARDIFLPRIVSRIDVVNSSRTDELNLKNRLFVAGPSVVRMFCRIHPQRSGFQQFALFLELLTCARSDSTADYRYDFGIRMSVRGHLEVGGELDA